MWYNILIIRFNCIINIFMKGEFQMEPKTTFSADDIKRRIEEECHKYYSTRIDREKELIKMTAKKMYEQAKPKAFINDNIFYVWSLEAQEFAKEHGFEIVCITDCNNEFEKIGVYLTFLPEEE